MSIGPGAGPRDVRPRAIEGPAPQQARPAAPARASRRAGTAYRADIDGLRAVAIVFAVAFHYRVPGITGGYLGADLFFVISGFLIASLFARDAAPSLHGIAEFYARRIKRLAPAFLLVAAVTTVVATALLLPEDYHAYLRSLRDSLLLSANRYFARTTTDYFASDATRMPWLHTWSLSVELQFYVGFPLLFLAVQRIARARAAAWLALVVVTAGLSIVLVDRWTTAAYFSATARLFEFLLGVLATCVPASRSTQAISRWLPWVAVPVLSLLAVTYGAATPYPGVAALVVSLIGFGLIVVGRHGSPLSHPAFVWIGRRSYSIYLWHWPIVAFANDVVHRPSAIETVLWLVGVVLVADLTYRFVERPGLRLTWRPVATFVAGCVLPLAIVSTLLFVEARHDGLPGRLGPEAVHALANIARDASHRAEPCHDARRIDLAACAFGDLASPTEALLIGDSHARHFRPFLDVLARDAHVKAYGLTERACATLEGSAGTVAPRYRARCVAATERDFALVRSGRFRFVVIAQRWVAYDPAAFEGLDRSLATIVAAGATPILFASIAEDGTDTSSCFYRHIKLRRAFVERCDIRANDYVADAKRHAVALLAGMQRKYPTLIVIDPQRVQCAAGSCATVIDDTPIYADTNHLNAFGATRLGEAYLARIGNPLRPGGDASPAPAR